MKKLLAIILTMSFIFTLTACAMDKNDTESGVESSEPTSSQELTDEYVDIVDQDIKDQFTDFSWPTFGNATLVPAPDWCTRGKTWVDDETGYSAYVDNTTKEQYDAYIKKLYDSGYNAEYSKQTKLFTGTTADGKNVMAVWHEDNVMFVDVWFESEN